MWALRSAGSPPISRLKARSAETVLSYSWGLGRFIQRVRHGADCLPVTRKHRAESTVCLQLLLGRFSQARRAPRCGRALPFTPLWTSGP